MIKMTRVLTRSEEARERCIAASKNPVVRYVATYINARGERTLMAAAQGRNTYATPGEAQAWIDAVGNVNSADTIKSVWGENPRMEVRPCPCWPEHFDPMTCRFDLPDTSDIPEAGEEFFAKAKLVKP